MVDKWFSLQAGSLHPRVLDQVVALASHPDFTDQPEVGNGASDLMVEVFGDAGRHARAAVGVAVLEKFD